MPVESERDKESETDIKSDAEWNRDENLCGSVGWGVDTMAGVYEVSSKRNYFRVDICLRVTTWKVLTIVN